METLVGRGDALPRSSRAGGRHRASAAGASSSDQDGRTGTPPPDAAHDSVLLVESVTPRRSGSTSFAKPEWGTPSPLGSAARLRAIAAAVRRSEDDESPRSRETKKERGGGEDEGGGRRIRRGVGRYEPTRSRRRRIRHASRFVRELRKQLARAAGRRGHARSEVLGSYRRPRMLLLDGGAGPPYAGCCGPPYAAGVGVLRTLRCWAPYAAVLGSCTPRCAPQRHWHLRLARFPTISSFPRSPRARDRGRRQRPQHARGDADSGQIRPSLDAHPEVAAARSCHPRSRVSSMALTRGSAIDRDATPRDAPDPQKPRRSESHAFQRLGATGEGLRAEDEVRVLEGARVRSPRRRGTRPRHPRDLRCHRSNATLGVVPRLARLAWRTPSWGCRRFRLRRVLADATHDRLGAHRRVADDETHVFHAPEALGLDRSVTRCPGRNAGNRVRRPQWRRASSPDWNTESERSVDVATGGRR